MQDDLDKEIEAAIGDIDLFALEDESLETPRGDGDLQKGTVVAVQRDDILVDLGGKNTGVLPVAQLGDETLPKVGDTIEFMVTGFNERDGVVMLSRKDAIEAASWATLHRGQRVSGIVSGHNKGGLELKVDGIKAFMPISQIDLARVESEVLPQFAGRRFECKVQEVRHAEKSLIVSRREILAEEAEKNRERAFEQLEEGQIVCGTVKTIMPYGAFVDLGGFDGLLHIKDMSFARIDDPKDVVSEGQKLDVMVLKVDRENRKIGLGLKQTQSDPWDDAEGKWPINSVIAGRVTRLADFGAFVEVTEGVEGLVPISEMSYARRVSHPREIVNENDVIKVRVMSIDPGQHRMSLSIKQVEDDPWMGASLRWRPESVVEGRVTRLADFGAFVELASGVEGLVHISELSDAPVRHVGEVVKEGQTVQAKVLDVDEDRRRISLSIKQLALMPDYTGEATNAAAAEPRPKKKRKRPLKGGLEW